MKRPLRLLIYLLRIRRVEYRIAELPILGIPVFLTLHRTAELRTGLFAEGVLLFLLLFAFGDMVNCLSDRDLDSVGKPHLSEAIAGLGLRCVRAQIGFSIVLALVLALHLSWRLNRWSLLPLILFGLLLGAAYSAPPLRLKGRGPAHLGCLWMVIFVGPMLLAALLLSPTIPLSLVGFAAAFATLQMGIVLVNSAEDYREDRAAGVRTTIVALGLRRGILLAFFLTVSGGLALTGGYLHLALQTLPPVSACLWILPLPVIGGIVCLRIHGLCRKVCTLDEDAGMEAVRKAAREVPLWITGTAWSAQVVAIALYALGSSPPLLS